MFACLYLTYLYIDGLSMHSTYYSIVIWCVSDLVRLFLSLFIFALIDVPMFWLFLIVDRFHWLQCYYTFWLRSLWTISHIRTLWHHFNPSNVTITYISPTTPILNKEKHHTSFPRPHKTSYHFNLTQTVFPCVIRPCPSYIDLNTLHSTLFYCILLIILCFNSGFISFTPILLNLSLPTTDYFFQT